MSKQNDWEAATRSARTLTKSLSECANEAVVALILGTLVVRIRKICGRKLVDKMIREKQRTAEAVATGLCFICEKNRVARKGDICKSCNKKF